MVKETALTTLSAIVLTLPLSLYYFGRLALLAPLVNLLILPVIPWAMGLGLVVAVAGWLYLPLGQVLAYGEWLVLTYVTVVVKFFASLSLTSLTWRIDLLSLFVLYFVIFGALFLLTKKKPVPLLV